MFHLQASSPRPLRHARPFADWFGDVQRQLMRRTSSPLIVNEAPHDYWVGLYHCGETPWDAADEFIMDRRL